MPRFRTVLAAALLASASASGASAQELIDATDPGRILEIAKGFGSADLGKDSGGSPKITGRMDGIKYVVFFYGCKGETDCKTIQFYSGWTNSDGRVTADDMGRWNRENRYSKAYLDDDGDVAVEMDVMLERGVSVGNLDEWFSVWRLSVTGFEDEVISK
jgi:hypothetical protein